MEHKSDSITKLADKTSVNQMNLSKRIGIIKLLAMLEQKVPEVGNCDTIYNCNLKVTQIKDGSDTTAMVATTIFNTDSDMMSTLISTMKLIKSQLISIKKEFSDFRSLFKKQLFNLASAIVKITNDDAAVNGDDTSLSPLNNSKQQ